MKEINKEDLTKIIAGFLIGGFLIYLYVFYFWLPYSKKINNSKKEIEKIEKEIMNAKTIKAQFHNLQEKLSQLEVEKQNAQKKLPKEKKLPDLLNTIKKISDRYSVKIISINMQASTREQYFTKVNYSLSVKGNYHNIGRFFTAIACEERILNIENLTLSQIAEGNNTCVANFNLAAYQYGG